MNRKLPLLQIAPTKRHLITSEGAPFFWLGDTAWELFHRLNKQEVVRYLDDRASKGYTIIQAVILAELEGLTVPNALGDLPLLELDPTRPNEPYFAFVDFVLEEAAQRGIYIGLLPTWGDKYNKAWGVGPEIFTPDNAFQYGKFLGERYKEVPNIVWVMGGDRLPADEEDYRVVCRMSEGIRAGGALHLMTMHPKGGHISSLIYGKEEWLQIDMFQSLHMKGCKEYRYVRKARRSIPPRPIIDGEPGYENIPNFLNKWQKHRLNDFDVRRAAYWSMLSGAAGHTYGCNEIWQMHAAGREPQHRADRSWAAAMQLPGAAQMGYMKSFFERLPWQRLLPDQTFLGGFNWPTGGYRVAMVDEKRLFAIVYTPEGKPIDAKLGTLKAQKIKAYWFDPATGTYLKAGESLPPKKHRFRPNLSGSASPDRVLLLMEEDFASQCGF
ncbi:MAG: glycoside hydrolase family 140 protein [Lunatimonas sp.]|uniref:apiosidase-like domain-containing protein n=1 Tax=Lunatimonas sp. TaxID=2060141 RepID=UPI00263A4DA5|nr:DUF4038 domain-containing protein [Lunatimonas sp.]MCC5937297.1 glycoside hydrolase family 140 protein [Lunatimonas sp.]